MSHTLSHTRFILHIATVYLPHVLDSAKLSCEICARHLLG